MKDDFRQRTIRYLARQVFIFEQQIPGPNDPDLDTLFQVAEDLGIMSEVEAVNAYMKIVEGDD